MAGGRREAKLSAQLEGWLGSGQRKTIGGLVETFGPQSFAIAFVVLMAFPALPLPTGGISHVLEIVTMLLAIELALGRTDIWLPKRWEGKELKGVSGRRFRAGVVKRVRWFERFSRPRAAGLFDHPLTRHDHLPWIGDQDAIFDH